MHVANLTNGQVLGSSIKAADSFFKRLTGLMFRGELAQGEGLILSPCNSIHTFGMIISLDIAYISNDNKVIRVIHSMRPNRIGYIVKDAYRVLELPAGTLKMTRTAIGDMLAIY